MQPICQQQLDAAADDWVLLYFGFVFVWLQVDHLS